jgi:hypothetical protein
MGKNGHHTIDPAHPIHYHLEIYEASFMNDVVVGSFSCATPFMAFHIGELFDPRCLIRDVNLPHGDWWKITNVVHRVWEIEKSHVSHQVGICVTAVPRLE